MNILSSLISVDLKISTYIVSLRNDFWNGFFNFITWFGSWQAICLLFILISFIFYFFKKRSFIIQLAVAVVGSGVTAVIIKYLIDRIRPGVDIALFVEKGASFPSAHAALSFALFISLTYFLFRSDFNFKLKITLTTLFSLVVVLVGFSRLYLGVHFLTDVIVGYLVGLLWVLIVVYFSRKNPSLGSQ